VSCVKQSHCLHNVLSFDRPSIDDLFFFSLWNVVGKSDASLGVSVFHALRVPSVVQRGNCFLSDRLQDAYLHSAFKFFEEQTWLSPEILETSLSKHFLTSPWQMLHIATSGSDELVLKQSSSLAIVKAAKENHGVFTDSRVGQTKIKPEIEKIFARTSPKGDESLEAVTSLAAQVAADIIAVATKIVDNKEANAVEVDFVAQRCLVCHSYGGPLTLADFASKFANEQHVNPHIAAFLRQLHQRASASTGERTFHDSGSIARRFEILRSAKEMTEKPAGRWEGLAWELVCIVLFVLGLLLLVIFPHV
jgi:hypothetical protein